MVHIPSESLITFALALAFTAAIPAVFPRLPLPGVVLEIMTGAVLGPHVLGLFSTGPIAELLATLGLGLLFLMAGFEIAPDTLRGAPIRLALAGWALSALLAVGAIGGLATLGLDGATSFTALALTTTAIGALMPVLRDSRLLVPPYGPFVLAAGAVGEAAPVVTLSLLLAAGHVWQQAAVLLAFAAGAVTVIALAGHARRGYAAALVDRTMGSSGQLPMRLAMALLLLMVVLVQHLGIDVVLGAFAAGALLRAALAEHTHGPISARLDGIGSAFVVPMFFIVSGAKLDIGGLLADPATLAMVPVYAALMLAVRGVPVMLLYRGVLDAPHRAALALHLGTQISLVVAITAIAVERGLMPGSQGAALVGGGILTTLLFPALSQRVLGRRQLGAGTEGGPPPVRAP